MSDVPRHVPVLQTTVLDVLRPKPGERALDVTLGLGGHAASLLEATSPDGHLTGIDADGANLRAAGEVLKPYGERVTLVHANFGDIASLGLPAVDLFLADLGLSSPHLDDPERGFSFRFDAPLDMRFDQSRGRTAAEIIRDADEKRLADILYQYGEIHESRMIAKKLAGKMFSTTIALKEVIEELFGWRAPQFLPRVFQAMRIAVNNEMQTLANLLMEGPKLLKPGGRMAVISYHSLEDRQVKTAFRALTTPEKDPVTGKAVEIPPFQLLTKKALVPSPDEEASNPRSRSAKLRVIIRT